MLNIGEYVKIEKQARGWTLRYLEERTGIPTPHISRLMNNPPLSPEKETVEKYARAFGVEPSDIWRAISDHKPIETTLERMLCDRIARHLRNLPREKQEKAVIALEKTAQGLADLVAT